MARCAYRIFKKVFLIFWWFIYLGVAGVSRTSALSDHRLASMAAAARSGAKRSSSSRKQPQMLQSRNPVVAHWYTLDKYFDGDTFADLEGFLV